MTGELQSLVAAIRVGDSAYVDKHLTRVVVQRVFKAPGEESTEELKNSQLIDILKGCEVTETTPVDLGLEEDEVTHQVLWGCPAKAEKPALNGKTIFVRRGDKFEVVAFFLPAGLPSLSVPIVTPGEKGSD